MSDTNLEAAAAAANAFIRATGDHVFSVFRGTDGAPSIHLRSGAIPALVEAGGVWGAWYNRDDGGQQRSLTLTIDGAGFVAYESRVAPLEKRCEHCDNPATCVGRYEGQKFDTLGCDTCCGHGCEDGYCSPVGASA